MAKAIREHSAVPVKMVRVRESNGIRRGEGCALHKTTQSDKLLAAYGLKMSVD